MPTSRCSHVGLIAALLALVSHLALGAVVIPDDPTAARATLASVAVFCTHHTAPAPIQHHREPGAVCPLGVALASPACALQPTAEIPEPPACPPTPRWAMLPPSRGPPPPNARVGIPRAPPTLTT